MNRVSRTLHPLSHPQKRIWYTESLHLSSAVHNIGGCVRFHGAVDRECLESSIHAVLSVHEGIRLQLTTSGSTPMQYAEPYRPCKLPYFDFSSHPVPEAAYAQWVRKEAEAPFGLYEAPLFYIALFTVGENDHGFLLKAHHIICDGWSMDVLTKAILGEYHRACNGESILTEASEPEPSYLEYLDRERQYLNSPRYNGNRKYWKDKFATLPELLFEKSAGTSLASCRDTRTLDRAFTMRLKATLTGYNLSLPLFLTAALALLCSKYYQKEDLVLAVPVAGRDAVTKPMVGMFTGTLPLRLHIPDTLSLRAYLQRVRREFNHGLANHKYPYDLLVHELELRRKGRDSLYQVAFNYYNTHLLTDIDGVAIANEEFYSGQQAYPLQLLVKEWEDDGTISFSFDYQKEMFSAREVDVLFECLFHLLAQMLENPDGPVKELKLLTEHQFAQSVQLFNALSEHEYPRSKTVMDLFEERSREFPDRVAVSHGEEQLTYRELSQRVSAMSLALAAEYSPRQRTVGIMMGHSADFVIAVLAVLQAGGSFLPIDPALPPSRIGFMLHEAEAVCLLVDTEEQNVAASGGVPVVHVRRLAARPLPDQLQPQYRPHPGELAYIIYTSGSTGQPKGVLVPHSNLANYMTWAAEVYVTSPQDVFAFYSSISFDLTLTSLFVPLISGTQLRIYGPSEQEYVLHRIIRENKATVIKLTPSHLALMGIQPPEDAVLRTLIVGGESLRTAVAAKVQELYGPSLAIYNEYGPTEATVGCMVHRYDIAKDKEAAVPIGVPAANARLYVLDRDLKLLPPGAAGELYISGSGVAAGYFHRPELTDRRFLPDPFSEDCKMYRTGDLVKFSEANLLEYLGRSDSQVKLRGYRIETEEIEHCLLACDGVQNAAVIAAEVRGVMELVAYIVCSLPDHTELKRKLAASLPAYMVPQQLVAVPEIPLTSNGKVDQERLAQYAPEVSPSGPPEGLSGCSGVSSTSAAHEVHLLSALQEILEREQVNLEDHFFQIGGDSIKAIQVAGVLKSRGLRLSAGDILDQPYVRDMVQRIAEENNTEPQGPAEGTVEITPIISWFLSQQLSNPDYYHQSMLLEVDPEVPRSLIERGLQALIRHHDSLRLCYSAERGQLFYNLHYEVSEFKVHELDLTMYPDTQKEWRLEEQAASYKEGLRLDGREGLAFQASLIHTAGYKRKLLLTAHHICIDGVSWRILLEDLAGWLKSGGTQPLPPKTGSYQRWAAVLAERGESLFRPELGQWMEAARQNEENSGEPQTVSTVRKDCQVHTVTLSKQETEALLDMAARGHRNTPDEVLQTTLVLALHDVFAREELVIWLEGHGREALFQDLDVSRTVGWFTSLYPVPVRVDAGRDEQGKREMILEQLRSIPRKGVGYGVLAHMLNLVKPAAGGQVLFNYLGEFPLTYGGGVLQLLNQSSGPDIAGENRLPFALEINAYVMSRQLHIVLHYVLDTEVGQGMEHLIQSYTARLAQWTAESGHVEDGVRLTPADFEEVELSQQELDSLFN